MSDDRVASYAGTQLPSPDDLPEQGVVFYRIQRAAVSPAKVVAAVTAIFGYVTELYAPTGVSTSIRVGFRGLRDEGSEYWVGFNAAEFGYMFERALRGLQVKPFRTLKLPGDTPKPVLRISALAQLQQISATFGGQPRPAAPRSTQGAASNGNGLRRPQGGGMSLTASAAKARRELGTAPVKLPGWMRRRGRPSQA